MQQAPKVFLRSILLFLGIYIGLMLVFSTAALRKPVSDFVRGGIESTLSEFSEVGLFRFFPKESKNLTDHDILIEITSRATLAEATEEARRQGKNYVDIDSLEWTMNSWRYFTLPLIFLIALVLATPVSLKRRLLTFGLGVVMLLLFIYIRVRLGLVRQMIISDSYFPDYEVSGLTENLASFLFRNGYIEFSYVLLLMIWLVSSFRLSDLQKLQTIGQ